MHPPEYAWNLKDADQVAPRQALVNRVISFGVSKRVKSSSTDPTFSRRTYNIGLSKSVSYLCIRAY
jgi:hypothetical protein